MIEGFVGLPGQGKTYQMTRVALKHMKKGIPVYANYNLQGSTKWNQVEELFEVKEATILIDEAGLVAPAGFWKAIPFDVMAHWRQHRHKRINVYFTAQDLQDIAVPLRRVTQYVNECKKFGPLMITKCTNPRSKEKYGSTYHFFDIDVAKKYDSYGDNVAKQDFLKGT